MVRAGDHVQGAAAARAAAARPTVTPRGLHDLAVPYTLAVALARHDGHLTPAERARLSEEYAASAVALLRRAQAAGFFTVAALVERLRNNPELAPLRSRADFQALVRDLEKKMKEPSRGPG